MKILGAFTMLCLFASGAAWAEDYSVALVNPGGGFVGGGTAVNIYRINESGFKVIQTYVRQETDYTGNLAEPLAVAINPQHDFVYVVYTGPVHNKGGDSYQPIMVGLKITHKGLEEQWEVEVATGGPSLAGTSISAKNGYVVENTFPSGYPLFVVIVNQLGQEIVSDFSTSLVSGHVSGKLYYSCRSSSPFGIGVPIAPPATSVAVFEMEHDAELFTRLVSPQITSTDPVFVASVCN